MLGDLRIHVTSQLEPDIEGHLVPLLTGRLISLNILRSPRTFSHISRTVLATDLETKRWPDDIRQEIETTLVKCANGT